MKLKCSPYYILTFVKKFSLLLLTLPLQSLLTAYSEGHTKAFFISADILVFCIIFLCALISLQSISLSASTSRFTLRTGVLRKQKLTFERRKLQSISVSRNILQRLLGVCKVTLVSGTARSDILLSTKSLVYLPCSTPVKKTRITRIHQSKISDILIMSAGFSPALGAALSFAPFMRSLSKLSAEDISYANLWIVLGYDHLPPLLAIVSSLLFILWLMGAILSFFRYFNMNLCKDKNRLQVNRGILSKHHTVFTPKSIGAVVFSQSLIAMLFCRQRAQVILANEQKGPGITVGCLRESSDRSLISKDLGINISSVPNEIIRPDPNGIISYTLLPLLSLSAVSFFSILVSRFSPYRIEPHLGVFLCLWCCIWFLHRCFAFRRSSISLYDNILQICTYSRLSILDAYIPTNNVRCTKITQNIFQRFKGTCNLRIFIKFRNKKSYIIRHINVKKAAEFNTKLCG